MYNDYFLSSDYVYDTYVPFTPTFSTTIVEGGAAPPVTGINGAVGPNITIVGTGLTFNGSGGTITVAGVLGEANGGTGANTFAGARANLGAAESGVNADITMFTNLASSGGWNAWTGGSDKSAHATFSGTASALYTQAELQSVMDSLKQTSEGLKALLDTLLASGIIKL